jgi:CAAX protease family protein
VTANPGRRLVVFFALSYALMWMCFLSVAAFGIPARSALGAGLLLLGAFAPGIAAVVLTAAAEGRAGVAGLLARIGRWQVAAGYYAFALGLTVAVKLTAAVVVRLASGAWPHFGEWRPVLLLAAVAFSTPFQAGEEVGWRGYALPRLAVRFGLRRASLLLGIVWAVWHIPQFFIPDADTYRQSFVVFALGVVAFSVILAWLYARTRGSLLLVMLLHAAYNNTKDVVPSALPGGTGTFGFHASAVAWLSAALLGLVAVVCFIWMPSGEPWAAGREIRA